MDVFCDLLLDAIHRQDTTIGNYQLGNLGGALNATGRFARTYPKLFAFVSDIHCKRGESDLSHAKKRRGNAFIKNTSFIKFSYFKPARKLARAALAELKETWSIPEPRKQKKVSS